MSKPDAPDSTNDVTRRQWLLRLGEMVALAGVSGLVPDASTLLFAWEQAQTPLPPGLYDPSAGALVHALSSAHKPFTPPAGSETDYAPPQSSPFAPQFFSADEFRIVRRFAEVLLGNIDPKALAQTTQWIDLWVYSSKAVREVARNLDPMHRAVTVAYFGESSVKELETADPQVVAREGRDALAKLCADQYNVEFLKLDAAQQAEIVQTLGTSEELPLRKFFELVREQAIRGYFTSPEGHRELDYKGNAYYGECPGCDIPKM